MALLQIKAPRRQCTSQWIEDVFYRRYPHLRVLSLKSFRSPEQVAVALNTGVSQIYKMIIRGKDLHAVEFQEFTLIHPDSVIDMVCKKSKKLARQMTIKESL